MDTSKRCYISLIALAQLFVLVKCQGGLSSNSDVQIGPSRLQQVTCAHSPDTLYGEEDSKNTFGGSMQILGNGSVVCQVEDDTVKLLCISVMKMKNTTDVYGNVTRTLEVTLQNCFTKEAMDNTECSGPNEKCTDWLLKGKPDKDGYCCCTGHNCNRKDNLQMLPYVEQTTIPIIDPNGDVAKTQVVGLVAGLLTTLLIFSAIIIAAFIIWRRRSQRKRLAMTKMAQCNEMGMYSDDPPDVNYDDMKLELCIHRGRFGDVYKAKLNDDDVCVKYFHAQQRNLFITEKEIYEILDRDIGSVVKCLACDERTHPDGTIQYMVIMEYLPYGSLASYLKTHILTWRDMFSLAKSAANGLGYLHRETFINGVHKHAVVHRDINSRNILVRADMTCAIADMGFSMKIRGSKVIKQGVEEHAEDGSLRDVGTVRYMAPEILDCAVNLRDCESSLKQIDMYAFSLVLWELLTRCKDLLLEPKRYMLPFEEELGSHPGFEAMRIHVAKEHRRPSFPVSMKQKNDAIQLLKETIEECWDTDSEARLSAVCVEERVKDIDSLMEAKSMPDLSKNDMSSSFEKKKRLSSDSADMICSGLNHELSPLLETDTPASEKSSATTVTLLQTPSDQCHYKPDVNIEMDKDRQLAPKQGRNIVAERNTMHSLDNDHNKAVHDNTLMSVEEAKARMAAEEERSRRLWEGTQQQNQTDGTSHMMSPPPPRSVQLDIRNDIRDPIHRVKENNLNVRRHNSQRNLYESSTSSNGGPGMMVTIPDNPNKVVSRPKSLNIQQLNIKPEAT